MAQEIINSADEAIDALGGPRMVAKALGVSDQAVFNWRDRGFPSHRFIEIRTLLRRHRLQFSGDVFPHMGRRNGGAR